MPNLCLLVLVATHAWTIPEWATAEEANGRGKSFDNDVLEAPYDEPYDVLYGDSPSYGESSDEPLALTDKQGRNGTANHTRSTVAPPRAQKWKDALEAQSDQYELLRDDFYRARSRRDYNVDAFKTAASTMAKLQLEMEEATRHMAHARAEAWRYGVQARRFYDAANSRALEFEAKLTAHLTDVAAGGTKAENLDSIRSRQWGDALMPLPDCAACFECMDLACGTVPSSDAPEDAPTADCYSYFCGHERGAWNGTPLRPNCLDEC